MKNIYLFLFTFLCVTAQAQIINIPDAAFKAKLVEADLDNGIIRNLTTGAEFKTEPFPEFVQKIIENGGLIQSIADGVIK